MLSFLCHYAYLLDLTILFVLLAENHENILICKFFLSSILIFMGFNTHFIVVNLREKSRLGQNSNSGIPLYALARFRLRHPDEPLDQARTFLLVRILVQARICLLN